MKAKVELLNNGGVIGSEPDPVTIDLANITRTVAIFDSVGPAQSLGGPSHVVIDGVRVTQIGGTFHKDLPVKSAGHDYAQVPTGAPVIVVLRGASTPASIGVRDEAAVDAISEVLERERASQASGDAP